MAKPQEVSNPRRILAVSLEDSTEQLTRVIKDLTGNVPESASATASLAGTTHDLELKTAYYTATVPIWLDLVATPSEWADSFLSPEAKEVLEVLGGVIVVFAIPTSEPLLSATKDFIREVGKVVTKGLGWQWDGVGLGIGVGELPHLDDLDVWDEACGDAGLEFVHVAPTPADPGARNEFGEKMGIPRAIEAIQSNDWASFGTGDEDDEIGALAGATDPDDGSELDPENLDFGYDKEDFEGLKQAIWEAQMERTGNDDAEHETTDESSSRVPPTGDGGADKDEAGDELGDEDIQKVEEMMRKLQAVRDMSAGLPEDQRKRIAARAVGEVMKDL
ncbi:hypothetical protein VPNG_02397 [Cytospora leucostoma]|uniref:Alpha and gamma adaptin binding protein p34 n=1 Tax=Cytospora leucostoma TaxID=1230097 RepID=A0A423XGX2_9PEZI|nr:hypothetical protein VPNG_02397 [Cytospora leucostoma]